MTKFQQEVIVVPFGRDFFQKAVALLTAGFGFKFIGLNFYVQLLGFGSALVALMLWVYLKIQTKRVFDSYSVPNEKMRIQIVTDEAARWERVNGSGDVLLDGMDGWKAWLGLLKEAKFPDCDSYLSTPAFKLHGGTYSENMPRRYHSFGGEQALLIEFKRRTLLRIFVGMTALLILIAPMRFVHGVWLIVYGILIAMYAMHYVRCILKSVIQVQWDPDCDVWRFQMFDGSSAIWRPSDTPRCPIGAPKIYGPFKGKSGRFSRFDWYLNRHLTPQLNYLRDEILYRYYNQKQYLPEEEARGWWP